MWLCSPNFFPASKCASIFWGSSQVLQRRLELFQEHCAKENLLAESELFLFAEKNREQDSRQFEKKSHFDI